MSNSSSEIGLVGLGVMGRNLVLNMADHGFPVAVYNRTAERTRAFIQDEVGERNIHAGYSLAEFCDLLRRPRAILLLVKAGAPVDAVIDELVPFLSPGDLLIDGGNSHFADTDRRGRLLADLGLMYLGMGISGGESGARHGPSLMPGGSPEAYERVRPILEASAAQVNGEPCVVHLGPGSAGHYVKMVHNGIEYGLMQLIAETYDLMKRGLDLSADELHTIYDGWNRAELNGFLMEITARIFLRVDDKTGEHLINVIRDKAGQKGTGMWTSQDAMALQVPLPTIDAAVAMRDLSAYDIERSVASQALSGPAATFHGDRDTFIDELRRGLYAAMIITYAQGMAQLRVASQAHDYGLELAAVARIWRGGCIIRSALLEELRAAYQAQPDLPNLLADERLSQAVVARQGDLRAVVRTAAELGIPAPGLMVSLAYFDGYRSARLPANLIQAQRDYFGAHTYQRIDEDGAFHTEWDE